VAINLPGIEDEAYRQTVAAEAETLASRAAAKRDEVLAALAQRKE
jgi:formiminotetrahydrofolate cyclodeaminase